MIFYLLKYLLKFLYTILQFGRPVLKNSTVQPRTFCGPGPPEYFAGPGRPNIGPAGPPEYWAGRTVEFSTNSAMLRGLVSKEEWDKYYARLTDEQKEYFIPGNFEDEDEVYLLTSDLARTVDESNFEILEMFRPEILPLGRDGKPFQVFCNMECMDMGFYCRDQVAKILLDTQKFERKDGIYRLRKLVEWGVPLHPHNEESRTLIEHYEFYRDTDSCRILLHLKADPNQQCGHISVLQQCMQRQQIHLPIAKLLISHGADMYHKSGHLGDTSLALSSFGNLEFRDLSGTASDEFLAAKRKLRFHMQEADIINGGRLTVADKSFPDIEIPKYLAGAQLTEKNLQDLYFPSMSAEEAELRGEEVKDYLATEPGRHDMQAYEVWKERRSLVGYGGVPSLKEICFKRFGEFLYNSTLATNNIPSLLQYHPRGSMGQTREARRNERGRGGRVGRRPPDEVRRKKQALISQGQSRVSIQ